MNFETLEPDVYVLMRKHFTPGRGGRKIKYIARHHNAGVNLTTEDCARIWEERPASAHYQVENSGRIGQLVNDWDTAWHAADLVRNQESIGIEHANSGGPDQDWPISPRVIEQGAHLAAALCVAYKLGRPEYGVNIVDHKETGQTSCPYHLAFGGKYHREWMEIAQYWYDRMTKPKTTPPATTTPKESDMTPEQDRIMRENNRMLKEIRYQLTGSDQPGKFPGLPQSGGRTLYDLTSAIAEIEGVPGTKDIK
ncbi:peptidoglycan recognition protein family protein [Corynebacterium auriscanis]|uniref:peptidoglycan recognition protein family protein n=1 Tax=Corynebacterium auriscanis TaxID=99807 RepID=UPI0024AE860A|nr:peptidoglycan recognition family protein [Corynebacterium auriscanis]